MQHSIRLTVTVFLSGLVTGWAGEEHLIANRGDSEIVHYAIDSGSDSEIPGIPNIWSVALDGHSNLIYCTDLASGDLLQLPLSGGASTSVYNLAGSVMRGLEVDYDQRQLYFLDSNDDTLNVMDLHSGLVTRNLANGFKRPNDMVMDRKNRLLYITDSGNDTLYVYDIADETTNAVLSGPEMDGIWGIDLYGESLYLSDFHTNGIYTLDLDTHDLDLIISGQETPRGLCVDEHHKALYWLEAEENILWTAGLDGSNPSPVYTNGVNGFRDLASYETEDRDGDRLNDDWERLYFTHLLENGDGNPDNDAFRTYAEFLYGSDPDHFDEALSGGGIQWTNGPLVHYRLRTDGWLSYELERSPDLTNWVAVSTGVETAFIHTGGGFAERTVWIDPESPDLGDRHFFRIRVSN